MFIWRWIKAIWRFIKSVFRKTLKSALVIAVVGLIHATGFLHCWLIYPSGVVNRETAWLYANRGSSWVGRQLDWGIEMTPMLARTPEPAEVVAPELVKKLETKPKPEVAPTELGSETPSADESYKTDRFRGSDRRWFQVSKGRLYMHPGMGAPADPRANKNGWVDMGPKTPAEVDRLR